MTSRSSASAAMAITQQVIRATTLNIPRKLVRAMAKMKLSTKSTDFEVAALFKSMCWTNQLTTPHIGPFLFPRVNVVSSSRRDSFFPENKMTVHLPLRATIFPPLNRRCERTSFIICSFGIIRVFNLFDLMT